MRNHEVGNMMADIDTLVHSLVGNRSMADEGVDESSGLITMMIMMRTV